MSNVNRVIISGSLAADPEVRWQSEDGNSSIVRLGVIYRYSKKTDSGEYEQVSTIFDVEVFGGFANLVAKKLRKFDNVTVDGQLQKDEWEQDGQKRSRVKVVARDIDSEGLFRSKDEDNDLTVATSNTEAPAPTQGSITPSGDDIPF